MYVRIGHLRIRFLLDERRQRCDARQEQRENRLRFFLAAEQRYLNRTLKQSSFHFVFPVYDESALTSRAGSAPDWSMIRRL